MERKHIAHFTNTYKPFTNGIVRSVGSFRQALTELGHNVFIFAQQVKDYQDEEPFVFRYPAVELPLQEYPLTFPFSPFVDTLLPSLKLDVIHAHHPILLGQAAAHQARELKLPLVFTHHTRYQLYSHYVPLPEELVKKVIDRWVGDYMAHCHHVVVPSHSTKMVLQERYGITDQVSVVPTGIDLAPFAAADGPARRQQEGWGDDIVLISVGRLAQEKNWRTLLAAIPAVIDRYPNVRLVILGDGDQREELEKYARELDITAQVQFPGNVPFADVASYLKAADIFCFASITETQGLVTLEAMAAGLPVVAVAGPGTSDVVTDNQECILTDNDSDALAKGLLALLADSANWDRYQEAARQKASQFAQQAQAQKLLEVYENAIVDQQAERTIKMDEQRPIFQFDWQELFQFES